jgi:predicted metal-dependent phosphoesterase TrpH
VSSDDYMKIDLHCHSEASMDCITPAVLIPNRCVEQGIRVQAITDHNEIWAAQKIKAAVESDPGCDLTIIVGEEISTNEGEVIGLFLQKEIEAGLSAAETIRRIREQNGLVLLPHGFDPLKRYRLKPDVREQLVGSFDIVETFNARISRPRWNETAVIWATQHQLPMSGGSDAHRLLDIGDAWVEVPRRPIQTPADLLEALGQAKQPDGKWTHPVWAYGKKAWHQLKARWRQQRGIFL